MKESIKKYLLEGGIDIAVTSASTLPVLEYSVDLVQRNAKVILFSSLPTVTKLCIDPNYLHYNEITFYGTTDSTIDDNRQAALMAPYPDL